MAVSILAMASASCFGTEAGSRRGAFAFHYAPALTEEAFAWYSQFDVLVTHDPLPLAQVDRLRAGGTKLLIYEWSVAFYESRATEWQRSLLAGDKSSLLNTKPLTGGAGSETAPAWYFDPAGNAHEKGRAAELARFVAAIGYDGVFFDTTTVESVHAEARREYERRHRETPYDVAYSRFLLQLRREMPKGIIFTNQGYRSAEHYLPYADWDLTESLITRPGKSGYELRPWNDPADPWNSILFLMRNVIEPVAARYPHVRFGHLNYISDADPATIRIVIAVSQIFGGSGFVAARSVADEVEPMYFRDPGMRVSQAIDHADGNGIHRFFSHGVVAVRFGPNAIAIRNQMRHGFRDRFTGLLHCGGSISLAAAATPRAYFLDATSDCSGRR